MAKFDDLGAQIPDDTPVEIPVHIRRLNRSFSVDEIRKLVNVEISRRASLHEMDSIQEADDLDVDDDSPEFVSQYEMREEFPREFPVEDKAPKGAAKTAGTAVDSKLESDKAPPAPSAGGVS